MSDWRQNLHKTRYEAAFSILNSKQKSQQISWLC